jgi:mannose-1-phosphate guanylyltransferase
MFIWQAKTLLGEMARLQPELYIGLQTIAADWQTPRQEQTTANIWAATADSTIDQGIMERSDKVAVVPADLGWSDVGDWHGLGELLSQDSAGNSFACQENQILNIDSQRSVIWSDTDRLIALVGVEDTVVVDTPDALLIVRRDRAQDVKRIVQTLKKTRDSQST